MSNNGTESDDGGNETRSLKEADIVSTRTYGRRSLMIGLGVTLLGGGAALAVAGRANADDKNQDADRFTDVVNPDSAPDNDPVPQPSDAKDTDATVYGDAGDSDERTLGDGKIPLHADTDQGTFRDPKDTDQTTYGDSKDAD